MSSHAPERVGLHASLSPEECYRLLGPTATAHVNLSRHALPADVAVALAVDGEDLLVRADPRALRLLEGSEVTVEVDATDLASQTGWRVVVMGRAVADERSEPWLRVTPRDVTGYRLPPRSGAR